MIVNDIWLKTLPSCTHNRVYAYTEIGIGFNHSHTAKESAYTIMCLSRWVGWTYVVLSLSLVSAPRVSLINYAAYDQSNAVNLYIAWRWIDVFNRFWWWFNLVISVCAYYVLLRLALFFDGFFFLALCSTQQRKHIYSDTTLFIVHVLNESQSIK